MALVNPTLLLNTDGEGTMEVVLSDGFFPKKVVLCRARESAVVVFVEFVANLV